MTSGCSSSATAPVDADVEEAAYAAVCAATVVPAADAASPPAHSPPLPSTSTPARVNRRRSTCGDALRASSRRCSTPLGQESSADRRKNAGAWPGWREACDEEAAAAAAA